MNLPNFNSKNLIVREKNKSDIDPESDKNVNWINC